MSAVLLIVHVANCVLAGTQQVELRLKFSAARATLSIVHELVRATERPGVVEAV